MIDVDVIEAKWGQLRIKIKERWGKITDKDLDQIGGTREELASLLRQKYGFPVPRAEEEIDRFISWATSKY